MKKAIKIATLSILLGFAVPKLNAATSKYHCDNLLFYAMDTTHKKEVRVCASDKNIIYTFGKISVTKPELELKQKPKETEFLYDFNDDRDEYGGALNIYHHNYTYSVRGVASKEYPFNTNGLLSVWKGDDVAAQIQLDPLTIIDNIKPNIERYGITVMEYD